MSTPNRIRELRIARGLSEDELAQRVETSQVQISRLERGDRKLTVEWMMRLAKALDCAPEDLLGAIALAQFEEEATPYQSGDAAVDRSLAAQNQFLYAPNSRALENLGFPPDAPILFDQSADACARVRTGDVVIVQLMSKGNDLNARTIVRQFIAPDLLTTNRQGRNFAFHLEEEEFTAQIRGVHRQPEPNGHG